MTKHLLAGALVLAAAAPAAAVTIDFNDRPAGLNASPLVYPEATFTTATGQFFVGAAGVDDEICPLTVLNNCEASLTVTFASAVNNLTFEVTGEQSAASRLFLAITTDTGTFNISLTPFDGVSTTPQTVSLLPFSNVLSLTGSTNDPAGIAYDQFTFDIGSARVPEPAAWALMIAGFGLAGSAMRRRRTGVAFA